jgi:hypothetical protein
MPRRDVAPVDGEALRDLTATVAVDGGSSRQVYRCIVIGALRPLRAMTFDAPGHCARASATAFKPSHRDASACH